MPTPALFLAALILPVCAVAEPIPRGTSELAGSFDYQQVLSGGMDETRINFSPGYHYFPSSHFFFGPVMDVTIFFVDTHNSIGSSLGAEAGAIFEGVAPGSYLYAGAGASWLGEADDDAYMGDTYDDSWSGIGWELFAGIKARLGANFCLNLQPSLDVRSFGGADLTIMRVKVGFSGLLFPRAAASQP